MKSAAARKRHIEPMPAEMLAQPLDFFFADHFRQRTVCSLMEDLANAQALDTGMAEEVLAFLREDMALHVRDEEEDLFPLLRRRCDPEDEIDAVLGTLAAEHDADERLARTIVEGLTVMIAGGTAVRSDPELREILLEFARCQRRHLALENNIVLPIARMRLTEIDLANLSKRMEVRHGLER